MSDYLVEVSRGRELLYQTPLALRAAMRSGEISPDSRIFHRTSSTWVSITKHPESRRFLTDAHPPAKLDLPTPVASAGPPDRPGARGFFRSLADRGAGLVRRLKMRGDSQGPKPLSNGQPEPQRPTLGRDRWTFLP
jgi:hypothetical protein